MSKPPTPETFLACLRKWHVRYRLTTLDGIPWSERDSAGSWSNLHLVANHHDATAITASTASVLALLAKGRKGLPGPLCHCHVERDGIVSLVGWGNANHAGKGDADVLKAVLLEDYKANPPKPDNDTIDFNELSYGIEWRNDGRGQKYSADQIEAGVRLNCAILDYHGWSEKSSIQHGELTKRKVDMSLMGGPREAGRFLRAEIKRALELGPDLYSYPSRPASPQKPMESKEILMSTTLVFGMAGTADERAVSGIAGGFGRYKEVSPITNLQTAKRALAAGASMIIVGGPAIKALDLVASEGLSKKGNVVFCNGREFLDSVVLLAQALKQI